MIRYLLVGLFIASVTLQIAEAQEPIASDRPGQSMNPQVVGKGNLQFQTGYTFNDDETRLGTTTANSVLQEFRLGVSDHFELGAALNWGVTDTETGQSNQPLVSALRFRTTFLEGDGWRPTLGFQGEFNTPIYTDSLSRSFGALAPKMTLASTQSLTDWLSFSSNVGLTWGAQPSPTFFYTANIVFSIGSDLGIFIEEYAFFYHDARHSHFINTGAAYLLKPNIQLDIGGGIDLAANRTSTYFSAGISWRPAALW